MNEDQDRKLDHPIELARDVAELVHRMERLTTALERQGERESQYEANVQGSHVNNVLFSGAVKLTENADGTYSYAKGNLRVPFAAITVEDANEQGPLLVVNAPGDATADGQSAGDGRWLVPRGGRRTIPITGNGFTITAIAPPAYTQLIGAPEYSAINTNAGAIDLVNPPSSGAIRVRAAWLTLDTVTDYLALWGSVTNRVAAELRGAGSIGPSGFGVDGPIMNAGEGLQVYNPGNANVGAGAVCDVVSTTGDRLVYVTLHTAPVTPAT